MQSLGDGAVQVDAGNVHNCARKGDGTVWCWGHGKNGQLGDGTTVSKPAAVQVTALGGGIAAITVGGVHNCARKGDGTVWCWGNNAFGELGNGTTTGTGSGCGAPHVCQPTPVQATALGTSFVEVAAGADFGCARKNDGTLWCWGSNANGQLGDGTTGGQSCYQGSPCQPSPVQVTALGADVAKIAVGHSHACARKNDGTLWCWGNNANGQLGDGTTGGQACPGGFPCKPSPVQVTALGGSVVDVALGGCGDYPAYRGHTCAVKSDKTVWCWGSNVFGQLGDGTSGGQSCYGGDACVPSPKQVAALGASVVAIAAGVNPDLLNYPPAEVSG